MGEEGTQKRIILPKHHMFIPHDAPPVSLLAVYLEKMPGLPTLQGHRLDRSGGCGARQKGGGGCDGPCVRHVV